MNTVNTVEPLKIHKIKRSIKANRDCYNSYFYLPEDENCNILDQFKIQGTGNKYLDGGSANHVNLGERPTKNAFKKLIDVAIKTDCEYFCFNILYSICNNCNKIYKNKINTCKCGSENIDYATRIIGYLTRISSWSAERIKEHKRRAYKSI